MKRYSVNEIFYSLQGEGIRAGTANVFVRFAACNLECRMEAGPKSPGGFDCDTQFSNGLPMTADDLVSRAMEVGGDCRAVIFTGGEPLLQLDDSLLTTFSGWHRCIETNGSLPMPSDGRLINFICVSPKVAEHALKIDRADEVKYVLCAGQALPKPHIKSDYYLLSPAWNPNTGFERDAVAWCIKLIKENPIWRLSTQQHKMWDVR